jgi:hypothetical protein
MDYCIGVTIEDKVYGDNLAINSVYSLAYADGTKQNTRILFQQKRYSYIVKKISCSLQLWLTFHFKKMHDTAGFFVSIKTELRRTNMQKPIAPFVTPAPFVE